jgi:hypothetical protein
MDNYRFAFVGADSETPAATLACDNDSCAMQHAEGMAAPGGGVHVWRGADSIGIIFSKLPAADAATVHPVMRYSERAAHSWPKDLPGF